MKHDWKHSAKLIYSGKHHVPGTMLDTTGEILMNEISVAPALMELTGQRGRRQRSNNHRDVEIINHLKDDEELTSFSLKAK